MANVSACYRSMIATAACTLQQYRSPASTPINCRWSVSGKKTWRPMIRRWKCGNPKTRDSHIPTASAAPTRSKEETRPKQPGQSVKYVPGLKCKTCPRLDSRNTSSPGGAPLIQDVFRIELDIVFPQKRNKFLLKRHFPVMRRLVQNVSLHRRNV